MPNLYGGTILRIDLTKEEIKRDPTSKYAKKYFGGRGINVRILYEEVGKDVGPLDPENIIAFGVGPLSGTMFPGSSRVDSMTKSPVTNLIGNSNFGGDWGAEFKYAGYDNLIIKGKAAKPVYIYIENDKVEIRDAEFLWGKTITETARILKDSHEDEELKIVGIGPPGENKVIYASLQTNVGNAGARTGLGCVLGSKNVKAIAVRGTKGVQIADPEKFFEVCMHAHNTIKSADSYEETSKIGITDGEYSYVLSGLEASGDAHKTAENFDSAGKTDFRKFWEKYKFGRTGCFGCPIHCMENYNVPKFGGAVISCELYSQLTWEVRNDDMLLWYECVKMCQEYGLDNTSIAIHLAWLMEMYEQGILTKDETDGIEMKWGDRAAILGMIKKTINREGFGSIIADGMEATAKELDKMIPEERRKNKSTRYFAMQVNNNPMFGVNPRFNSVALGYSVGRRSDCITDIDVWEYFNVALPAYPHMSEEDKKAGIEACSEAAESISGVKNAGDPYAYDGKAALVADMADVTTLADMLGTCKWHTQWFGQLMTPEHYAETLSAGLGIDISAETLIEGAKRIKTLERAYENIQGRTRKNDMIPEKEFDNPVSRGPWKGLTLEKDKYEKMKEEYYEIVGWDVSTGIVEEAKLKDMGLDDVMNEMKEAGLFDQTSLQENTGSDRNSE